MLNGKFPAKGWCCLEHTWLCFLWETQQKWLIDVSFMENPCQKMTIFVNPQLNWMICYDVIWLLISTSNKLRTPPSVRFESPTLFCQLRLSPIQRSFFRVSNHSSNEFTTVLHMSYVYIYIYLDTYTYIPYNIYIYNIGYIPTYTHTHIYIYMYIYIYICIHRLPPEDTRSPHPGEIPAPAESS